MTFFFSCDWGTSTFRLRLADAQNGSVLSSIKTGYGIAAVFESWKQSNLPEENRRAFYQHYIFDQVKKITASLNYSFTDVPVILSGMASSSIGMLELPYKDLPFKCNGSDLIVHTIHKGDQPHKIIMISGVRSAEDVIRGEETMLAGCTVNDEDLKQLFIFPGTHSKHIILKNGFAQGITTYITGEIFHLLSTKSILAASIEKKDSEHIANDPYFVKGVIAGTSLNLMNCIFHVRTNQLFGKASLQENYCYLSGLLIGHELKDVAKNEPGAITLVCDGILKNAYIRAIEVLELNRYLQCQDAEETLVKGQLKILHQLGYFSQAI